MQILQKLRFAKRFTPTTTLLRLNLLALHLLLHKAYEEQILFPLKPAPSLYIKEKVVLGTNVEVLKLQDSPSIQANIFSL
jgi:hypothetical protein